MRHTTNISYAQILHAACQITAALTNGAIGQQDEKLGKVVFPNSCDPNVQTEFDRGVAMLHSYWFLIARRKLRGFYSRIPPARWHTGVWRWTTSATPWQPRRRGPTRRQLGTRWKKRGWPGRRRSVSAT